MKADLPENERERLAVLASFGVLDTPAERRFDDLALLATTLCGTPIALISLVDRERQWFKAKVGLDVCETHRDMAFCAHAILQPERLLVVPDTLLDPRFAGNPLVTGEPGIRFYAGAPITANGVALGTICVIDRVPRQIEEAQCEGLRALARQASSQLELGRGFEVQQQLRKVADATSKLLKDSKERLQGIFDSALDAIVSIDADGSITAFNAAAEKLFCVDARRVLGQPMVEVIVPPAYQAAHLAGMARFQQTGNTTVLGRRIEITARRIDGGEFPVELAIASVQTSKGQEFTAFIRDISARLAAELELAAARDAAELANRVKGQFLANMSHEIRTPLNGIIGVSEIALDEDSTENPREMLELIRDSGSNLLDIVNSILDFSKIESTGVELHPRPFRPRAALGDALRTLAVRAKRRGLEFDYEQDESVPPVLFGDAGVIRQIVFNLVGNSIKFTNLGFVKTELKFDGLVGRQAALRIVVSDSGIGIAADELEQIFQAFAQSDASDSRAYGGTGLGLAITRQLVAALGGRIAVESTPGAGSIFTVSLLLDVAEGAAIGEASAGDSEQSLQPNGQHVLVLDDNATNRLIAGSWLRRHGYRTTEAESGVEALKLVAADPPDLMLVDIQMPGMSGLDFLNLVRACPGPAGSTPAVALTAHALAGDRERFLGLGMEGYIAKPFSAETLLGEVGRVLGLQTMALTLPATTIPRGRFARTLVGLNGDEELFSRLAAKASASFLDQSQRIIELARQDEWRLLGELVHQIKGSWDFYARDGEEGLPAELMSALARMDYAAARMVTKRTAVALREAALDLDAWMQEHGAK